MVRKAGLLKVTYWHLPVQIVAKARHKNRKRNLVWESINLSSVFPSNAGLYAFFSTLVHANVMQKPRQVCFLSTP